MPVVDAKCVQPDRLCRDAALPWYPNVPQGADYLSGAATTFLCNLLACVDAIDTPLSAGSQPQRVTSAIAALPSSHDS